MLVALANPPDKPYGDETEDPTLEELDPAILEQLDPPKAKPGPAKETQVHYQIQHGDLFNMGNGKDPTETVLSEIRC